MRLPPLNALRAFEAAARHKGYAGAAEELCVTRGAISRHVKLLEEHLGVRLFKRLPKGIELTDSGGKFLPVLTEAFDNISDGARRVSGDKSELRILCPPTISIRWLIPRLDQFRSAHPDIRIRLTTDFFGPHGFDQFEFDLSFSAEHARDRSPDTLVLPLFPMIISPACAPKLMTGNVPLKVPEDLARFTLLHESAKHNDWKTWLDSFRISGVDPTTGDVFPNLDIASKAAVMGTGVIMGDLVLNRSELEMGTLVMPFEHLKCEDPRGRFCLLGARDRWSDPQVEAFKQWALDLSRKDVVELSLDAG
jgi:LysR family glycine cleavage system transcriptional activator